MPVIAANPPKAKLRQPVKKDADPTYSAIQAAVIQAVGNRLLREDKDGSDLFSTPDGMPVITVSMTKQKSVLIGVSWEVVNSEQTLKDLPWGEPYCLAGFKNQNVFLPITEIGSGTTPDLDKIKQVVDKIVEMTSGPDTNDMLDAILAL